MLPKSVRRIIGLCLILGTACTPQQAPEPTATPAPPTATASPAPTATPEPTATPTPTETPVPTATPTSTPDARATEAAAKTATVEAAISQINEVLADYDLSTDSGRLGYLHPTLKLKVNTYGEDAIDTQFPDKMFKDFVLHTRVTWTSTTGLAGCFVVFRSDGDFDKGKHYRLFMMRLQGLPLWDMEYYSLGRFQRNITGDVRETGALFTEQGSENQLVLIAQGGKLAAYGNGERMGIASDSKLAEGTIAYGIFQESGETTCTYEDTWVWELESK